jgi:N-acetylglucosamine-6-phosphate deacetylase
MSTVSFTGRDPLAGGALRVTARDGTVVGTEPVAPEPDMAWLAPGLVDLQVNGFGGLDLNDGALEAATVSALCRKLAAEGITRFLPTIITAFEPEILAALIAIADAVSNDPLAARMVAGIHVEGPFLSPPGRAARRAPARMHPGCRSRPKSHAGRPPPAD